MENNTQTTTQKLETALTTLISAYEDIQNENKQLNSKIEDLEEENRELNNKLDSLSSDSGKKDGAITGMLGKIESILGGNTPKEPQVEIKEASIFDKPKEKDIDEQKVPNLDDILGIKLS